VMAARELGIEALDALVLPDISDAQRIELELALNRLPEDSTWDDDTRQYIKLAIQIAEKQNNEY
jgi:ParB-like chromosome segregation protein Spo0J